MPLIPFFRKHEKNPVFAQQFASMEKGKNLLSLGLHFSTPFYIS